MQIFNLVIILSLLDLAFPFRHVAITHNWKSKHVMVMKLDSGVEEYVNPVTSFLGKFLPSAKSSVPTIADSIDWQMKKRPRTSFERLASDLQKSLTEREWFVTGNVDPKFFDSDFKFQDPDVKVNGIEQYARGVNKLFDQKSTRGQIISCVVNSAIPDTITVTWRLEGRVNLGPKGVAIKAFICTSDLLVNPKTGLIIFQEDKFSIPGWDIILSAFVPWLPFLAPSAPPVMTQKKR